MNTLSDEVVVVADTENHRQGEGYERTLIYGKWDDADQSRLAKVHIRVDRYPANSFARVWVWVKATGWQDVTAVAPEDWWESMPGFTRGQTFAANRSVMNLADDLIDRLIESGV